MNGYRFSATSSCILIPVSVFAYSFVLLHFKVRTLVKWYGKTID